MTVQVLFAGQFYIGLCLVVNSFCCVLCLHVTLAIYTRSPAAFRAVQSLGILQLPCCKELQRIVSKNADGPGIHEHYIAHQSEVYEKFCDNKVESGRKRPMGVGVLIFDETKVKRCHESVMNINNLKHCCQNCEMP